MKNPIKRILANRKLVRLDEEHARLAERVAQARKHHERVTAMQNRLQALTAQILQIRGQV